MEPWSIGSDRLGGGLRRQQPGSRAPREASGEAPPPTLRESGTALGDVGEDPEIVSILSRATGRRLLCRACDEPITDDGQRIAIEGRHVHHRTNPAGFDFEFGCFNEAPGALAVGEATSEHSWFSGFTWSFAICRACDTHLGWQFEGDGELFYGLILSRLEAEKPDSGEE